MFRRHSINLTMQAAEAYLKACGIDESDAGLYLACAKTLACVYGVRRGLRTIEIFELQSFVRSEGKVPVAVEKFLSPAQRKKYLA